MSTESRRTPGSTVERDDRLGSISRYDLVLALIPAAFLLTAAVVGLFDVSVKTGLTAAGAIGAAALADAMFLNPPTPGR